MWAGKPSLQMVGPLLLPGDRYCRNLELLNLIGAGSRLINTVASTFNIEVRTDMFFIGASFSNICQVSIPH